ARVQSRVQLKSFKGERALETATRFGHFMNAALFGAEQSRDFCKTHGIVVKRAHSESDNESGGFLVPTEFENVMIDLRLEYGVFRRNANVVPMLSNRKERPRRTGGLTAYPIGARGTNRRLTESKKGWDRVALDAKKWGVLAKYEEELSDDSVIAMADDLASEIAYAFTFVEDECGFLGDGTSEYHGIVGVINKLLGLSNTIGNIAGLQVASGNQWVEIVLADILGMVGRLPSFARKTGQVKWYCSNEFWSTVLCRIALALGGNALGQIQNEIQPTFLGKPVEIVEVMPHVEANSQVCLLYGNLAQAAMFGDRRGKTVKMTDSNDTDFEEDLMAIKGTERFDINVHDVGNADATASKRKAGPVVGLITAAS
ncbi:MAG: phage major capsid protein, partial [Acidobacteriota bacterium]|nr:phage major capsid protein [Acidobacteriota bacterium]